MIGKKFRTPSIPVGQSKTFNVFGKSFFKITSLFLSGGVYGTETLFNPFSASTRLSAQYPEFYAIQLSASEYTYDNNSTLTFTMPSATYAGNVDVILLNEAGWGPLTRFVVQDFKNPYPLSSTEHDSYVPYQRPWKNGIISFSAPLSVDSDLDGFTNGIELSAGTNPNDPNDFPPLSADSDLDGFTNEMELSAGTNPNDPNSYPI